MGKTSVRKPAGHRTADQRKIALLRQQEILEMKMALSAGKLCKALQEAQRKIAQNKIKFEQGEVRFRKLARMTQTLLTPPWKKLDQDNVEDSSQGTENVWTARLTFCDRMDEMLGQTIEMLLTGRTDEALDILKDYDRATASEDKEILKAKEATWHVIRTLSSLPSDSGTESQDEDDMSSTSDLTVGRKGSNLGNKK